MVYSWFTSANLEEAGDQRRFEAVFREKQLNYIRENWSILTFYLRILILVVTVLLGINSENSSILVVRTITLILLIFFLCGFQKAVEKFDWAAKYSGPIFTMIIVVAFTEINAYLCQYRLYEGFMTQISLSFLMSVCMSTNWVLATLLLFISYLYYIIRMMTTFDSIPHELVIALAETCIFYALGTYLNSRTLLREVSANCKAEESSKEFKQVLKCLPDGALLVDNSSKLCLKFYNPQLVEDFDINLFCEPESEFPDFADLKDQINRELYNALQIIKEASEAKKLVPSDIQCPLRKFKIIQKCNIANQNSFKDTNSQNVGYKNDYTKFFKRGGNPLMKKTQKLGNPDDIRLNEFLGLERHMLEKQKENEREGKISVYFDDFNFIKGIEMIKREFIVKTRKVHANDPNDPYTSMYLHILSDTTQITQLEEQKAQNKYQRQMLANVSHEFRTPLNAMTLSLTLLRGLIRGHPAKFLRIASSSCDILRSLVEDILDHAKIESGVFEIHEQVFKFNTLMDEVRDIFELQTLNKGIDLTFYIAPEVDNLFMKTDKQRIKQVLLNLISNSLKFTDRGAIQISLIKLEPSDERPIGREERKEESKDCQRLILQHGPARLDSHLSEESVNQEYSCRPHLPRVSKYSTYPDNRAGLLNGRSSSNSDREEKPLFEPYRKLKLKLTVSDTGIGIPKSDQSSLFKLFGKTSSNHNRNKTGCGLGLTICRKILQKLGGDITLESEEGRGTKVTSIFKCMY
ncbi:unnamed protein product [Moneuplotes crassus]|uniref:Histidine kinase domain-containing protein n=1 Tax=Euplotes crassus TaxID=5936 RepID=A0AAD2D7C4_EUPCR|nr:unnamed protein product [Moneuplotes crassus]